MRNRIKKAQEEYKAKRLSKFFTGDVMDIMDMAEGDMFQAILIAMESSYIIGFRAAKLEEKKKAALLNQSTRPMTN